MMLVLCRQSTIELCSHWPGTYKFTQGHSLDLGLHTAQMVSTTHCSLKAEPLKIALTVAKVGRMYISRTEEGVGSLSCPDPAGWSTRGCILSMTSSNPWWNMNLLSFIFISGNLAPLLLKAGFQIVSHSLVFFTVDSQLHIEMYMVMAVGSMWSVRNKHMGQIKSC